VPVATQAIKSLSAPRTTEIRRSSSIDTFREFFLKDRSAASDSRSQQVRL